MATAPSAGQTEALNGVRIYFETQGTGETAVAAPWFLGLQPGLALLNPGMGPNFQLILPGHGRPAFCRSRSGIKTRPTYWHCSTT